MCSPHWEGLKAKGTSTKRQGLTHGGTCRPRDARIRSAPILDERIRNMVGQRVKEKLPRDGRKRGGGTRGTTEALRRSPGQHNTAVFATYVTLSGLGGRSHRQKGGPTSLSSALRGPNKKIGSGLLKKGGSKRFFCRPSD